MSAVPIDLFRARRPRDFEPVSLGYRSVTLVQADELYAAQVGYSADPEGRSLTGNTAGDWLPTWLVVATEDETGDPIFVDLSREEWPVFTAVHGEGDWDSESVADSFAGFLRALEAVRTLARGRETPVALGRNPVSAAERDRLFGELISANPHSSLTFWRSWLEST